MFGTHYRLVAIAVLFFHILVPERYDIVRLLPLKLAVPRSVRRPAESPRPR